MSYWTALTSKGCQRRRGRQWSNAFTLIEVVVVIATVAILAALVLPVLAKGTGKVRRVECLSRLKQWTMAFKGFAEENEDWIARECYEPLGEVTINNWSQVKGRVRPDGRSDSADVWYNALPRYLGLEPATRYAAPAERPSFFDSRHLIHCPTARFPGYALRSTYQFPLFSLAMNSQLIQSGASIKWTVIEQHDVARTVLFLDNLLDGELRVHPLQETNHLGQPGAYANRFSARHQGGGNLAFADGHVAWFSGPQVVETDDASPLAGGPILPPRDIIWELYPY
jgi:prepilin-type processing-associated H-X9-DG protein/prepilin-type N-terminal cleavage/methylation domain-containing protein